MHFWFTIIAFAFFVLFTAFLTMWRHADTWQGMPFSRRLFLAIGVSWKWWLLLSLAILFHDAVAHEGRGVPADILVVVIAAVMSAVFAILRAAELRRSQPD